MYNIYTTPCYDITKLSTKQLRRRYNIPIIKNKDGHSNKNAMIHHVNRITPFINSGNSIKTIKINVITKNTILNSFILQYLHLIIMSLSSHLMINMYILTKILNWNILATGMH